MADEDPSGYRAVVEATRKLAGRQAISLNEAFRVLIDGEGDPDLMPVHVREGLCEVLRDFGYAERLTAPEGGGDGRLMWVRGPWPIDHGALSRAREVETLRPF